MGFFHGKGDEVTPYEAEFPEEAAVLAAICKKRDKRRGKQRPLYLDRIPIKRLSVKIGRNEPCICGSGIKMKKCCGGNT